MIPGIAEYVDVDPQHELLLDLYEKVEEQEPERTLMYLVRHHLRATR